MSFKLMALAATAKTQTPTQKLILLLLADKANDDGVCWPKMKTIAADACVTRQCVLENVKKLAALGFIRVQKRTVHDEELGHVRNASHIYMVNADKMREASGDRVNEVYSGGRVNEVYTQGKRGLHPKVNEDDNKNLSVEPINEPIIEERSFYTSEFEEFWKAYPRKIGKGGAFRAWKKVKARPPLSELLASVEAHAQSRDWTKDGGQFIPHPQTWLNQRRWEDEIIDRGGSSERSVSTSQREEDFIL